MGMMSNIIGAIGMWFNIQWEWIKSFISEENGKGSHRRALSVAVVTVFLVGYLKKVIATLPNDGIPDIPENWLWMISLILGINAATNLIQWIQAKKGTPVTDTATIEKK